MNPCWCRFVLAILIIVVLYLNVTWAKIAITILAALLAILALIGKCFCKPTCFIDEHKEAPKEE